MRVGLVLLVVFGLVYGCSTTCRCPGTQPSSADGLFHVGQPVIGLWFNKRYYPGQVTEIYGKLVLLTFDDGDRIWTTFDRVRELPEELSRPEQLRVGAEVLALYASGVFRPGRIIELRDKDAVIAFHDGPKLPILKSRIKLNRQKIEVGHEVLAVWPGNRAWYPGKVIEMAERKARVQWDDDGSANWVPLELVTLRSEAYLGPVKIWQPE